MLYFRVSVVVFCSVMVVLYFTLTVRVLSNYYAVFLWLLLYFAAAIAIFATIVAVLGSSYYCRGILLYCL